MPKYLTSGQRKRMQARKQGKKKYTRPAPKKKRAYPSARGNYVPRAYNVETKIIELPPQATNLTNNDASDTRPKNTLVILPASWDANTTPQNNRINTVDGQWATPCYINQKFRLSFDKLVADHVDSAEGFTLKMHIGRLKVTPSKFGARSNFAFYCADCLAQVYKELAESDFDSDFLEYSKRNRNIEIISTKNIVPNRNGSFRKAILPAQGQGQGETFTAPPPVERAVNHRVAKLKTRVDVAQDTADPPLEQSLAMFNNLWVPFVAFSCNQLTANTGYIHVEQSSRLYFQDM